MKQSREDAAAGDALARVADPVVREFGVEQDAAWGKNLVERALERISERVGERQLQVFDMHVDARVASARRGTPR